MFDQNKTAHNGYHRHFRSDIFRIKVRRWLVFESMKLIPKMKLKKIENYCKD